MRGRDEIAWKVSQVRTVDACKYRHEASAIACWVRMKVLVALPRIPPGFL